MAEDEEGLRAVRDSLPVAAWEEALRRPDAAGLTPICRAMEAGMSLVIYTPKPKR